MAGTITMTGLGSGIDTESIVSGLVKASQGPITQLKSKIAANESSVSNLSSISSLLSKLKSASDALDTVAEVGAYKATSSASSVAVSANGNALPGSYSIEVSKLAKEQRTYSDTFSSSSTALNQSGTLKLAIGSNSKDIAIASGDSLDQVIEKINSSGLRVSASAFYDGTSYRLQLRGLDTGAANAVSITETGTTLGLTKAENQFQKAQDAEVKVDGFTVKSPTNQIAGAIRGVTLAVTQETTSPVTVSIDNDSAALKTKLQALVDAYNGVVSKVQTVAGKGTTKATDANLAGDSTLRGLSSRMSAAIQSVVGGGSTQTLSALGLSLDKTGRLALDSTKLDKALQSDPSGVASVLAGAGTGDGVMDIVSKMVTAYTTSDTGLLAMRQSGLESANKALNSRVTNEQTRIDRYADQLRKQFTQMDTAIAGYNNQSSYLSRIG